MPRQAPTPVNDGSIFNPETKLAMFAIAVLLTAFKYAGILDDMMGRRRDRNSNIIRGLYTIAQMLPMTLMGGDVISQLTKKNFDVSYTEAVQSSADDIKYIVHEARAWAAKVIAPDPLSQGSSPSARL